MAVRTYAMLTAMVWSRYLRDRPTAEVAGVMACCLRWCGWFSGSGHQGVGAEAQPFRLGEYGVEIMLCEPLAASAPPNNQESPTETEYQFSKTVFLPERVEVQVVRGERKAVNLSLCPARWD